MKKLIVIAGPTASGKTAAAISAAQMLDTEIISADSRQIFKELTIGTAKPSPEELKKITHHFIGNKSIHEDYSAGQYGREALALVSELFKKHNTLVMVGGSGLYIKAALEGFDEMPSMKEGLREEIVKEYQVNGLEWLQKQVEKADQDYFSKVDRQNPQRLIRALELLRSSGKKINELQGNQKIKLPFDTIKIGLNPPREELYQRIDDRMDRMIDAGLFDEAKEFYAYKNLNALQTVGYREIFDYLDECFDYVETVRLLKRNSRRYAKRQLTWFQRDPEITWFENEPAMLNWLEQKIVTG